MIGNKGWFTLLQQHVRGNVFFGYKTTCEIFRLGKVLISDNVHIDNVILVDSLKFDLLSISQLWKKGRNKVTFTTYSCVV